jgi:hypothetical protein
MKCKLHVQPIIALVVLALGLSSLMTIIFVSSSTQLVYAAMNNNNVLPTQGSLPFSASPTNRPSTHPLCQTGSYWSPHSNACIEFHTCQTGSYWSPHNNKCMPKCEAGSYLSLHNNKCMPRVQRTPIP